MANYNLLLLTIVKALAGAFAGVSDEALFLLQSSAQHVQHDSSGKEHLPSLGEVLSRPKSVLQQMSSRVDELEQRLAEEQQRGETVIAREKAGFEHNLTIQREEIRAIQKQNARLGAHIRSVKRSCSTLRSNASTLRELNDNLVADLKALEANLSTAQEFLTHSLKKSTDLLEDAPELIVLRELDERESQQRQEMEHAQRLQFVGGSKQLSLLETRSISSEPSSAKDPHGLLEMLSTALEEMATEQSNSEAMLKHEFEKAFAAGAERRAELLAEQENLNSTKATAEELKARLESAVNHLQETHSFLIKRAQALRAFATKVGLKDLPDSGKAYSLLQLAAMTKQKLPDMKSILKGPSQSFNVVNSHVAELAQQLAEANQQSIAEAQEKKVEYDHKLHDMEHNNTVLHRHNMKLADDIAKLDRGIEKLRKQSQEAVKSNDALRAELNVIHANISVMQEFLEKSLDETNEPLSGTPELQVLAELAAEDQAKHSETSHTRSLAEIMPEKVALLQIGNSGGLKTKPHDLLSSLSQAMDSLMVEHEGSLQQLKEHFDEEFGVMQKRHDELQAEWSRLNATRAEKTELEHRLSVALAHLEKTGETLRKRRFSLLGYARRLADTNKPKELSLLAEKAVEKPAAKQPHKSKAHGSEHGAKARAAKRADATPPNTTAAKDVERKHAEEAVQATAKVHTSKRADTTPRKRMASKAAEKKAAVEKKSAGKKDVKGTSQRPWEKAMTWVKSKWAKLANAN